MQQYPRPAGGGDRPIRVGVVGGGISGLAAARSLYSAGVEVTVLESRDRVGGRLRGVRPDGSTARLDLGATWFWPNEPRVRALIDQLRVATHQHHLEGDALYHDPSGSRRLDGNPIDVPSGRFSGSAAALAEALHGSLPTGAVRLDTPVEKIAEVDGNLRIHHRHGEIDVDHVVLALPPALAVHQIEFVPALPDDVAQLAANTPVWMGAVVKVIALYDEPFWRTTGLAGSAISHYGPMREIHDMSGPDGNPAALFGFVPLGPASVAPRDDDIIRQLTELFGATAPAPTGILMADWSSDPHTSPPSVRHLGAYQTFGHPTYQTPTRGRIHWCSTETATTAPGHIEGALDAAARVTADIVDRPVPPPTNPLESEIA